MPSSLKISRFTAAGILLASLPLLSCQSDNVPYDTEHLAEYHVLTEEQETTDLPNNQLALYVDYSNCIANGLTSPFYQKMVSPLTAATTEYWSIKGNRITRESGSVYSLLNNVQEENYAALDAAIEQMADREAESVMLTDGELFTQTATKNNPNNPYMHAAFKKWLLKGHDIHIIAEPYQETYKKHTFDKKRFYIIFTDDRLSGNIYDRIKEVVHLEDHPQIDEFHLSGNYPWSVPTNGQHSHPNDIVAATISSYGPMEIQEWQVDWKNITTLIMNGTDENGTPLPHGEKLIGGLRINKNAFGSYRITALDIRVSSINSAYFDLYNRLEAGDRINRPTLTPNPINNFIIADPDEFKKHGNIDLYFDIDNFAPDPETELNGHPFNYFKIEILIKDLENILDNNIDMFHFASIVNAGQTNESISESLKNCVFDPELLNRLKGKVLYTIYVKSDKY